MKHMFSSIFAYHHIVCTHLNFLLIGLYENNPLNYVETTSRDSQKRFCGGGGVFERNTTPSIVNIWPLQRRSHNNLFK